MRKVCILVALVVFCFLESVAQKVGLVLSGGGAKGITHIGVIKALEENNIPIDYIAGTSMGAIIGSMYAMGMSPDDMIDMLKSEEFKYWSTGEIPATYKYFYRNPDPKPAFVELPFTLTRKMDSIQIKAHFLPTNLIPPRQMNYAFVPLFAQANAVAGGNFDKLFVPFRCVASDVYNKEAVVFRTGVLGDAVRASMTFPLVFKPLVINGKLLFDGGIYNNFPVDVVKEDFKPGYIIGSVVAGNPDKPDETDVYNQIQNMIISKTNYHIDKKEGFLFDFKLNDVSLFDFSPVDQLVKIGYDSTMAHINEIKERVKREKTLSEVTKARRAFKDSFPPLKFQHVIVKGVNTDKRRYVEKVFHYQDSEFTLSEMKEAYFKLISDDKILEVIPHAVYNPSTANFNLELDVKTQDQLKLLLGGNVSSSTSNQAFFGIRYQNLKEAAQTAYVDAQFGKIYNGLGFGFRIDPPSQQEWFVRSDFVFHKFDYYEGDQVFYSDNRLSSFNQIEFYGKVSVGIPVKMKGCLEIGFGLGNLSDHYAQNTDTITLAARRDRSNFHLGSLFTRIQSITVDNMMYPTSGYLYNASLQLVGGKESFTSVNNPSQNKSGMTDLWMQLRAKMDKYYSLSDKMKLGLYGELALTSRKLLSNYTVSVIEAPTFSPTPHSKSISNAAFNANEYAAFGVKPIYFLNKQLHLRGEAYWMIPYRSIKSGQNNKAYYSNPFSYTHFLGEGTLAYDFKIATAGLFANYYSAGPSRWNFGLNIGFLLFNNKYLE